jgi:ubiquinone/menaquinone biosynthesis C-methylase UbiE
VACATRAPPWKTLEPPVPTQNSTEAFLSSMTDSVNTLSACATGAAADKMRSEPSQSQYLKQWSKLYEQSNYNEGVAGYFLGKSHQWAERPFGREVTFPSVLEVGAGTGIHLRFVRHAFDHYWLTDLNPPFLEKVHLGNRSNDRGQLHIQQENAAALSFGDNVFDRVIAAHVLEHLVHPHRVLREWARVLKPGGVLSLVLPCDPGVAWRLGRALASRRKFIRAGLDYDYWMAREHVNSINNLVSLVRYYFDNVSEEWLPLRIPSIDINLFYIAHIRV